MLPKPYRLDVAQFPKTASPIYRGKYFSAKLVPNNVYYLRVGIITSRKVIPKAVRRNAFRRRIFDFWESELRRAPADLLIIAKPEIAELNPRKKEDLINLESELNLIKNKLK